MPPATTKRVQVDLHLMANADLDRLRNILSGFSRDLSQIEAGGAGGGGSIAAARSSVGGNEARLREQRADRGASNTGGGNVAGVIGKIPVLGPFATNFRQNLRNNPAQAIMEAAFLPQAITNAAMVPARAFSALNTVASGGGFTAFGAQQGLSTIGGVTSPAAMAGIQNTIATWRQATGTMGAPSQWSLSATMAALRNQSPGDIGGIRSALGAGMGFSNNVVNRFAPQLTGNGLQYLNRDFRVNVADTLRYGMSNIGSLNKQLQDMAGTATAAGVSLDRMTGSMEGLMQSMSQQFGTPQTATLAAGRRGTLATGLLPNIAMGGVNRNTMLYALAQSVNAGQSNPFYHTFGTAQGQSQAAQFSYDRVLMSSGLGTIDNAKRILGQPGGRQTVLNALYRSFTMAPEMWPEGMTPPMLLQVIERGSAGIRAGFQLGSMVDHMGRNVGDAALSRIEQTGITALGGGATASRAIHRAVQQAREKGMNNAQTARAIRNAVQRAGKQQTEDRALGHVSISLSGAAAELFNVKGGDSNTRNNRTPAKGGRAVNVSVPDYSLGRFAGYGSYDGG